MKRHNYWIGIIVSSLLFLLFFRKIDWSGTWDIISKINWLYILYIIALQFVSVWARARRWGLLLLPIKPIGTQRLFSTLTIGFMANNLLPARLGELVRAYLLGNREQISKVASLTTILVERLFDGLIVLLLFFFSILFTDFPGISPQQTAVIETLQLLGLGVLGLYLALITVLLLYQRLREKMGPWFERQASRLPQRSASFVFNKAKAVKEGLEALKSARNLLMVFFYSSLIWLLSPLSIYLLYLAFNIPLTFISAFFLSAVIVLGVSIPSSPGYLGTFHWACTLGLILLGVDTTPAKGFAMLLWVINFVPITVAGLIFLWIEGLTLKGLQGV